MAANSFSQLCGDKTALCTPSEAEACGWAAEKLLVSAPGAFSSAAAGGDAASAGTGEVVATAARACSVASLFSLASLRAAAAPVTERVLFLFATDSGLCLNADPSDPSDPSEPRDAPAELRCAAAPGPAESRRGARVGVNLSRAGARVPPASTTRSSAVAPFTPPPGVNTGGSPRLSIAWGAMPAASGPGPGSLPPSISGNAKGFPPRGSKDGANPPAKSPGVVKTSAKDLPTAPSGVPACACAAGGSTCPTSTSLNPG